MRILIVSDTSSYMRGGVVTETRILVRGLVARGHDVALLADAPLPGESTGEHFPLTTGGRRFGVDLRRALTAFRPEFVHVMQLTTRGLLRLHRLLAGVAWAVTIHSVSPYERKVAWQHPAETLHYALRDTRFFANTVLWRATFKFARLPRVVAHSRFVEDIVVRYGFRRADVVLVPLPFELPDPDRTTDGRRPAPVERLEIATVGGLAHTKGQHDLIKALALLRPSWPGARVRLVGEVRDTSYLAYLGRLAAELGVVDGVELLTDLDDASKDAVVRSAEIYVQPSHEEGFCLAYAEAAAVVPRLVGTRTGAIAAISDDDPGAIVVDARDPPALAEAIDRIARRTLAADHMSTRGQRLADRFSIAGYLDAHERLYRGD